MDSAKPGCSGAEGIKVDDLVLAAALTECGDRAYIRVLLYIINKNSAEKLVLNWNISIVTSRGVDDVDGKIRRNGCSSDFRQYNHMLRLSLWRISIVQVLL